ncbi:hypothetical protein CsSME_00008479 [Camellia sinensis var. sinensis]
MVGIENSMYVPVVNGIGGTSLTPSDFTRGISESLMSAPTQIFGSGSLVPSASNACTPGNLYIRDLFDLFIVIEQFVFEIATYYVSNLDL